MKIIFLNPQGNFDQNDSYWTEHPDFGGQLVYVKEVCMVLSKMGIKTDIVARYIDDPDWPEFSGKIDYYEGYEENLRIVRIPCGGPKFLDKEHLWSCLDEYTDNILSFYGDNLPEFATAHYGDGGYCGVLLKKKAGLGFTFTGHSLGAQKIDKLGVTLENFEQNDKQYNFSKRIVAERLSMTHAFNIITSTSQERLGQYSHELYSGVADVHDDAKFSVIPPGVNTRIFTTQERKDDRRISSIIEEKISGSRKPFIIVASRFDEKKNHIGMVKAYALSKELQARANLGIFVRGVDDPYSEIKSLPEHERRILQPILKTIEHKKIKDKVYFFNFHSQKELASAYKYFAKLDSVFALTAFYEPFGLAPIEAAACGMSVVATKNGGPSEIFEDGSGVLIDPLNNRDIAEGILKGIKEHKQYASRGVQRVKAQYTWEKTAEAYLSIIQKGVDTQQNQEFSIPELNAREQIRNYLVRK
jgi:sucrose-phosphate synthase